MTTLKLIKRLSLVYLLITMPIFVHAQKRSGGQGSGGGDQCENRIKIIRDDLKSWIGQGGSANLSLPPQISVEFYNEQMLKQIEKAKIKCVGPGDKGYPVEVDGVPKVCRFDLIKKDSYITCDYLKFNGTGEADQYLITHHEFAGLAAIENPSGSESNYVTSNQISDFLEIKTVKKLGIKRKPIDLRDIDSFEERNKILAGLVRLFEQQSLPLRHSHGGQPCEIALGERNGVIIGLAYYDRIGKSRDYERVYAGLLASTEVRVNSDGTKEEAVTKMTSSLENNQVVLATVMTGEPLRRGSKSTVVKFKLDREMKTIEAIEVDYQELTAVNNGDLLNPTDDLMWKSYATRSCSK